MIRRILYMATVLNLLAACNTTKFSQTSTFASENPFPSPLPKQTLELSFGDANESRIQSRLVHADNTISLVPASASSVCTDLVQNRRFLNRTFIVTNTSSTPLNNLILQAYVKTGNIDGTAFKAIVDFGGTSSPQPREALPSHGMTCGLPNAVDENRADLQFIDPNITTTVTTQALNASLLNANEYLLDYGYLVQQRSGDINKDNNLRTIAPGEKGQLTVALELPNSPDSAYKFSMTFLLTSGGANELVQTYEEQNSCTYSG